MAQTIQISTVNDSKVGRDIFLVSAKMSHIIIGVVVTVGLVYLCMTLMQQSGTYKGRKVYADGVYIGEFKDGKKEGFGRAEFYNGDIFIGHFKNDVFLDGNYTFGTGGQFPGDAFIGNFSNDRKECFGNYIFHNDNVYIGDVKTVPPLEPVYKGPNGEEYIGLWMESMRDGSGRMEYANGNVQIGTWRNHKAEGYGYLMLADGGAYNGSFANDVQHGQGLFQYAIGDTYNGSWTIGFKHGEGTYFDKSDGYSTVGRYEFNFPVGIHNRINGTQEQVEAYHDGNIFWFQSI